jgi:hypothetical protein
MAFSFLGWLDCEECICIIPTLLRHAANKVAYITNEVKATRRTTDIILTTAMGNQGATLKSELATIFDTLRGTDKVT